MVPPTNRGACGNLPQAHSRAHFGECTTHRQSKSRRRANKQDTAVGTKTSQAHTSLWKAKRRHAPQTANNAVSARRARWAKAFFAARHCRAPKPVHKQKPPARKTYSKVRSPKRVVKDFLIKFTEKPQKKCQEALSCS